MANIIWTSPISANWTTAPDWTGGVPTASGDAVIDTNGTYIVTLSSAAAAHSLTMDAVGATLFETASGSLIMAGGLTVDAGTVVLGAANSFGKTTRLVGGTLRLDNSAALGTSDLTIDGGTLLETGLVSISNSISANGTFTLAAGHGAAVTLAGQTVLNMNGGGTINFGRSGADGIFVWSPLTLGVADGGAGFKVSINDGTLRDGNGKLNDVLSAALVVNVAAGANLDVHGNSETIANLQGGGAIMSTVAEGALTVVTGEFSGSITNNMALTVRGSLTLSGANTYTGGTTIQHGATLSITGSGSVSGNIVDNGLLHFNLIGATLVELNGGISGTGAVEFEHSTILLNGTDSYSGGTTLIGGILEVGNAAAVGTGPITLQSGVLKGTVTEALSNRLIVGSATFAAAHGTALTLNKGAAWTLNNGGHVIFGDPTNDGVVVWDSLAGSNRVGAGTIDIAGGTLRAGDSNFQILLNNSASSNIESGATLDVAGFASRIYRVEGSGTIENSGASATVTLSDGNFGGDFSGPIILDIGGNDVLLSGDAANWSTINILAHAELHLESASSSHIGFSPGGSEQLRFDDPAEFTGSVAGFDSTDRMLLSGLGDGVSINYSGTAAGGTLTVAGVAGSVQITMVGDYTGGSFSMKSFSNLLHIFFKPASASAAPAHADSFDFSTAAAPHVSADAGVTHMHGVHTANEIAFAHDVTEAMHAHGLMPDHFAHSLFAHGHAFAEALL